MDPTLELYRKELVVQAGRKLDQARMIRFEERTGYFASTDLGRTASHFYIRYNTIEVGPHPSPLLPPVRGPGLTSCPPADLQRAPELPADGG